MSVVGVVDDQSTIRSSGLSGQPAEKKKKTEDKATSTKPVKPDKSSKSSSHRPSSSTNSKIEELDQKWLDRFNRLEALLLARTLDRPQELIFSTVKVTPSHGPPANVVSTEPFLNPADQPSQHTKSSAFAATDPPSSKHNATEKSVSYLSQASHRPATVEPTGEPVIRPTSSAVEPSKDSFSSDSDSDSFTSDRNSRPQARCQLTYPLMNGYVEK